MSLYTVINSIEDKLKLQSEEVQKQLYKKLDIETMEKFAYFELNSRSFASGKIDLDTSQFIYNKLRDYENTSLAERIVINEVLAELAKKRIV